MTVNIVGKNIDVGEALRERAHARLELAADKYFDGGFSAHVAAEKTRSGFTVDCVVHLDTGIALQASGEGSDAYQAFEKAADRIETRLRRYKRRLKKHNARGPAEAAISYVIAPPSDDDTERSEEDDNPVVIAETPSQIPVLSIADAVMALDLGSTPAIVFRHAVSRRINVVYRRDDGHVGWVDPQAEPGSQ